MTTETTQHSILPSPETDIRSDLWPTMSISQLYRQQEMIMDKITKIQSISPFGVAPTAGAQSLHAALQQALKDVTSLIDNRTLQKEKPNGKQAIHQ